MEKGNEYIASAVNAMTSSEGWGQLKNIFNKEISYLNKGLLDAKTFEQVLEIRAQIKCYKKILNIASWAKNWSEDRREPLQ